MEKTLNLVKNDPWLEPFAGAITGRHQHIKTDSIYKYFIRCNIQ